MTPPGATIDTGEILDILAKHNVHATFFMTGGWVESYPEDVKAIFEAGHDLGNHSQNHKNMSQLSDAEIKEELMTVHEQVKELTGYDMFLFRAPYGDYNNSVISCIRENNYYPYNGMWILWTGRITAPRILLRGSPKTKNLATEDIIL